MEIKIKKLSEHAITPRRSSSSAAGADLYALLSEPLEIAPGQLFQEECAIPPSSQKARLGPIKSGLSASGLPELQGILRSPGGHSGLQSCGDWEARTGLSRRKVSFPMRGGVVLSSDPGLSGPSLESGLASGGPADSKPGDTGRGGKGSCLPHLLPRPTPEKLTG